MASPTSGTWGLRFLPISAGSMSMWTMFSTLGAKLSSLVVTRSSQRIPIIISRSQLLTDRLVKGAPMKPTICSASGSRRGKAPVPSRVQPTGMLALCESSISSFSAPEISTPRPQRIIGRLAFLISSATF